MLNPIYLTARDLPDAWFQAMYACVDKGSDHLIDSGSFAGQYRKELDYITIHIKDPGFPHDRLSNDDLCPKIPAHYGVPNPVTEGYIDEYLPYLMTGEIKEGEQYTYGSRLWNAKKGSTQYRQCLDQVGSIIHTYKTKGYRNNQMVLQVAEPFDLLLSDPPCLRHLDTRIQDNKLHFFVYFRSWDLFSGFPSNLALIQILKEYMAQEIGVDDGEMIVSSKGLHLYDYAWSIAKSLKGGS